MRATCCRDVIANDIGTYVICIAVQRDFSSLRAANLCAVKRILRREISTANDAYYLDLTTSKTDASSYSHVLALHPPCVRNP